MMNGHLFPALEYYPWVSIVTVMWTLLHGSDGKGPCLYADRSWVLDATFLEVMMRPFTLYGVMSMDINVALGG